MTAEVVIEPATGLFRTEKHLYYWNNQGPFPGVTTVAGILDKPQLTGWYKKQVGECAMRNASRIVDALATGDADVIEDTRKYLSSFPDLVRDAAADLGTSVHFHAEQIANGVEVDVPEAVVPFIRQYLAWRDDWKPEYVAIEYRGINLTHRYGGTGDLIVRYQGENWLLDIKSGSFHDETAFQLVACAGFEFIGQENDATQYPVPGVDRFGVLDLKADHWAIVEYRVDRLAVFEAFTRLAALWHFLPSLRTVRGRSPFASGFADTSAEGDAA